MKSTQRVLNRLAFAVSLAIAVHSTTATAQVAPTQSTPATGCLSGYPNDRYEGDRPLTRNEFAAGMNTCLDQVNQQLEVNKANFATRTDFETLIQRQRELNAQLRELSDRVGTISGDETLAK